MIGGNVNAVIQTKTTAMNAIGERVATWTDSQTIAGWLDLSNGDSKHTNFSAKIQESTHVFLSDYVDLSDVNQEMSRLKVNGKIYEILLIDNPMEMNRQIEIYLRYIGGQDGSDI